MNSDSDSSVLFFVKYPAAGNVKSRLAQKLGPELAAEIYTSFVLDLLDTLQTLNVKLRIFFEPADALPNLRSWLGSHYSFVPQTGRDLGEKMKNAFIHGFAEGFSKLVLIGSDLPDLPADFLKQGLHALDTHDAVIGPSSDGGYYLIGFTKDAFLPKTFKNIPWGQTNVFQRTMNILEQHPKTTHILPQWHDVDTLGDLKSLCLRYEQSSLDQSRTATFLRKQLGSRSHV